MRPEIPIFLVRSVRQFLGVAATIGAALLFSYLILQTRW